MSNHNNNETRAAGKPPKRDPDWPRLFERHLPHVDPSILKLAREFCQRERKAVFDMAGWMWSGGRGGPVQPLLPKTPVDQPLLPKTPVDAIEVAITAMWENAHPELAAFRETIQ